jgi:pilus assembly protein CpaF
VTLSDRLSQARTNDVEDPSRGLVEARPGAPSRPTRQTDPFAEVKQSVHQALLESLGPKLYDARMDQAEIEQRVRQTLQMVLELEETPLTTADRTRVAQEVADEILGHGRWSRSYVMRT